ncbi:phage minor tail protein L [Acinetobacter ursingii]|uniref:phage minor tail protein L n=1 Tax=Acinetobacter ursingii TaxID=108980 RepID=UPI00124D0656|nr:phage minor tail protein L [Acinetobacter ursingii]
MSLNSDFQKLYVDGLITLYELDASNLGAGILRFHGHIAFEDWEKIYVSADQTNWLADTTLIHADKVFDVDNGSKVWYRDIIWQGQVFSPMAIDSTGFGKTTDGKAAMPTLTMANNINGVQGAVSAYCYRFDDFAGAKLKVITTLAKYLDAENFSQGNPSASNESEIQIAYIEQKTSSNDEQVVFELSNPVDFEGKKIPLRQITNLCHWACTNGYRGEQCGYTGTAMFTMKDEPTTDPSQDRCPGRMRSCRLRFGENKPLSHGGYPASSLIG